jgi:hypothetical protein
MPLFILVFSSLFGLFMFVIPGRVGLITKLILSVGIASAGVLFFLIVAEDVAMTNLGSDEE